MSKYIGFFKVDERGTTIWKNLKELRKFISSLDSGKYMIQISTFVENRTLDQNKYYWKIIEIIAKEIGYEPNELHNIFKYKFLQKTITDSNGNMVKGLKSTSDLNINEFIEYIDNIKYYVLNELEIILPETF